MLPLLRTFHRPHKIGLDQYGRWTRQPRDLLVRCGRPSICHIRSEDNCIELVLSDGADRLVQRSYLANRSSPVAP